MEYKDYYKTKSLGRSEQLKKKVSLQHKIKREKSRREVQQTFRNMSTSDDENTAPDVFLGTANDRIESTNSMLDQQYLVRLKRLQQFKENRRHQKEEKSMQKKPFTLFVNKHGVIKQEEKRPALDAVTNKTSPLQEKQSSKTPVSTTKYVKPRVDCWWSKQDAQKVSKALPKKLLSAKKPDIPPKVAKTQSENKPPMSSKSSKNARHAAAQATRPQVQKKDQFTFTLKPPPDVANSGSIFTSTVRKIKKSLAFSYDHPTVAKPQKSLTVVDPDELFDGISPIEVESSPLKPPTSGPVKDAPIEDSIWEPQPVASLSAYDITSIENDNVVKEDQNTNVVLNEYRPVTDHAIPKSCIVEEAVIDLCSPNIAEDLPVLSVSEKKVDRSSGLLHSNIISTTPQTAENNHMKKQSIVCSIKSLKAQRSSRSSPKASPLAFIEEPIGTVSIVPSKANLSYAEKIRKSLDGKKSIAEPNASLRRRSSVCPYEPFVLIEKCQVPLAPPKEVEEKTRYYYNKVDMEVNRLQALCDEYAPHLEAEVPLNDHCKGLIIAAQGQTNILINKKLSKFRELIGHYKNKWNDQKVRHDDLDGFWLMLSLDLENLDKRFNEIRVLKENNWEEIIPEPQPKVKKLQNGAGIRKREKIPANGKKPSSSVIADLIKKARQDKKKQMANLEELDALKDTATILTTPVKQSVCFGKSMERKVHENQLLSNTGFTPITVFWAQENTPTISNRQTIFPDITSCANEQVKSILKTPKGNASQRPKSVLFLDSGLETPQTPRRQSKRLFAATPKPKIKFNDELEIEHIDTLAARTPSRLEDEIRKRRQHSLMGSASTEHAGFEDDEDMHANARRIYPKGTPRQRNSAVKRKSRRLSRTLSALFDSEQDGTKRITRSSASTHHKEPDSP